MALLFEDTGRKRILAQNLLDVSYIWANDPIYISLHSGSQPDNSNFLSNWSTDFYYDSNDGSVGASVLGIYGATGSGAALSIQQEAGDSGSTPYSWNFDDALYGKSHTANGTASWAVIWLYDSFRVLAAETVPTNSVYMICPVSDASGTGVVKLDTTTVSGSLPNLADINIEIS